MIRDMQMTIDKAKICSMLDAMDLSERAELIQYYIESREGLKGYCRT